MTKDVNHGAPCELARELATRRGRRRTRSESAPRAALAPHWLARWPRALGVRGRWPAKHSQATRRLDREVSGHYTQSDRGLWTLHPMPEAMQWDPPASSRTVAISELKASPRLTTVPTKLVICSCSTSRAFW